MRVDVWVGVSIYSLVLFLRQSRTYICVSVRVTRNLIPQEDVMTTFEGMVRHVFQEVKGFPFSRAPYSPFLYVPPDPLFIFEFSSPHYKVWTSVPSVACPSTMP